MGFRDKTAIKPMDRAPWELTGLLVLYTLFMLVLAYLLYKFFYGWVGVTIDFGWAWHSNGSTMDALTKVWPAFVLAIGVNALVGIVRIIRRTPREDSPRRIFSMGTWLSLNAGFFDEIMFRWLGFFGTMFFLKLFNVITFGLVKWFYVHASIPVANWATFGLLEPQLHSSHGWLFSAAIVSLCCYYQEEHKYLGLLGRVNSWFAAMVLFYVVFNYGLWAAIVVHIVYNLCVFWIRAFMARFQPRDPFADLAAQVINSLRNGRHF